MQPRDKKSKPKQTGPLPSPQDLVKVSRQEQERPFSGDQFLPGDAPLGERRVERRIHVSQQSFDGPIPHPDIFKKYGEIIPDAPERILCVFEQDSKHARDIQVAALNAQKGDNKRVHWMAWSLIAGGFVLSYLFASMDKDWLAGAILTSTLAGTIAGFFQNRKEERKTSSKNIGSSEDN